MFERLPTEQRNLLWTDYEPAKCAPFGQFIVEAMLEADADVPPAIRPRLGAIAAAVEIIVAAIDGGGSLVYVGAGTSGRLAVLDAAECPPTFHTPPALVRAVIAGGDAALRSSVEGAEDDRQAGIQDLAAADITTADAVVGISASGRTPYVVAALEYARSLGARTLCITCAPGSELGRAVEFPIEIAIGPEIIAGSTRLRAGTATKLILNMLSTATMIQLGYTYKGLMVNVQPTNSKLEDRARRIIAELAEVSAQRAGELLEQAGRRVPVAIVMERKRVSREAAEELLAQARGRLGLVLEGND